MSVEQQLPLYQCYKRVWALKIARIFQEADGSWWFVAEERSYGERRFPDGYFEKHKPEVGGYWVQYADGYESWSPAEAFEGGYARVGGLREAMEGLS